MEYDQLLFYVEKHNILFNYQFGFRKGYSTEYAILETIENLKTAIDENRITCGIFLDFSKAFDTINHNILLAKMNKYGIRGLPLEWFLRYLKERKQYGKIGNNESSQKTRGGGALGSRFAGYVLLASQNPYPIIVYSVANYRPHLSHFWANVIVISRTELNASRLLNIKTTTGTIFQPRIVLFLNPCLPKFSCPKNPENLRPHSTNSTKNVTPL